jgi:phosphatidylglycerol:prolipoprotein diacylglycerol transferase
MWPVWAQLEILGRTVSLTGYGAFAILGAALGAAVCVRLAGRAGIPAFDAFAASVLALAFGLLGAKAMYLAVTLPERDVSEWASIALAPSGLVFYGGLLGGAAAAVSYLRAYQIDVLGFVDAAVPGLAIGHAFGRIGCFMAGCCYGRPTDLPWGVRFPASPFFAGPVGVPLHPVQLYEAGAELGLAGLCGWLAGRTRRGSSVLTWLFGYSALRLALELFLRGDDRGRALLGLTPSALLSLVGLGAALEGLALRRAGLTTETKVS